MNSVVCIPTAVRSHVLVRVKSVVSLTFRLVGNSEDAFNVIIVNNIGNLGEFDLYINAVLSGRNDGGNGVGLFIIIAINNFSLVGIGNRVLEESVDLK